MENSLRVTFSHYYKTPYLTAKKVDTHGLTPVALKI